MIKYKMMVIKKKKKYSPSNNPIFFTKIKIINTHRQKKNK
jgi:hypothetical protein